MSKIFLRTAFAAAVVTGGFGLSSAASAANISGAGATFPYPIYSKWAATYQKETGNGLNYQAIGSGGGIKQIEAKTVTFGASDAPLKPEVQEKNGLLQWPMVMGGIVPVLNIPGVKPGELAIDGPTLADIYLGKITKWNDPALAKLNPKVKLPNAYIAVVHRSDGSGTTFNFTNYLNKVSPDWKSKVGSAVSVEWPVGVGAKGNAGVAGAVGNTKDSIGYVEYAYAMQNKMTYMDMVNRAGKRVAPNTPTFQAAAANADWAHAAGFYLILTDQPGAKSWPITASTFILMHKQVKDPAAAAEALKFFSWAFAHGAKQAESLDYIPMPANVVSMIKKKWAAEIKGPDGKPVYTGM